MGDSFGIYDLIFLAVAVGVLFRLRGILGRRMGRAPKAPPEETLAQRDNAQAQAEDTAQPTEAEDDTPSPIDDGAVPGLMSIAGADRHFTPEDFLERAKMAYRLVIMSFAKGDENRLKHLVTPEVYKGFSSVIKERKKKKLTARLRIADVYDARILEAALKDKTASILVRFTSGQAKGLVNEKGEVVDGQPEAIHEMADSWTFIRDMTARDAAWRVAVCA